MKKSYPSRKYNISNSDQGCHYTGDSLSEALKDLKIIHHEDEGIVGNAPQESFLWSI